MGTSGSWTTSKVILHTLNSFLVLSIEELQNKKDQNLVTKKFLKLTNFQKTKASATTYALGSPSLVQQAMYAYIVEQCALSTYQSATLCWSKWKFPMLSIVQPMSIYHHDATLFSRLFFLLYFYDDFNLIFIRFDSFDFEFVAHFLDNSLRTTSKYITSNKMNFKYIQDKT